MKIQLLVVGKTDDAYIDEGVNRYVERVRHFVPFEIKVIPDIKNRKTLTEDQQKKAEGALILAQIQPSDIVVLLDENGRQFSSRGFADFIEKQTGASNKRLVFVVGGPYGFSEEVYAKASSRISLSLMTFSHQMVRLVFAEQLYRAYTILKGIPYHHD